MPLPIAHGLVRASIVAAMHPKPVSRYCLPLLIGAFLANCPDVDFILVWVFHSRAWHRAFSHSLFFALAVGFITFLLLGKTLIKEAVAYGLAFMSHGILDYVTTKEGGGVELLFPVSSERLKLGLVGLSEIPSRLTLAKLLMAVTIEVVIFVPLFVAVMLAKKQLSGWEIN